jgi:hypothetical protein
MRTKTTLCLGATAVAIAVVWAGWVVKLGAQQAAGQAVRIDSLEQSDNELLGDARQLLFTTR